MFSTCGLSCSIHPRDKQTVAHRLHLGARAVAYGEKTLTFQGPLPEKIERLADKGLLSITYSQQILVQRQDDKIFEVRRTSTVRVPPVWGIRVSSTVRPLFNMTVRQDLVGGEMSLSQGGK